MKIRFKISNERFFNNGRILFNAIPDVEKSIRKALSQEAEVSTTSRTTKGEPKCDGVNATSLNKALRRCLYDESIRGETHVENGVFFHKTKKGFDFSFYDEEYNLARLYNYYQGTVGVLNGDKKIIDVYKKLGYKKSEWKGMIDAISSEVAENADYIVDKKKLTVAGELQFGNWALIYRDLFRLLDADNNPGVDFYIYVTADDELSELLSEQTVSFKSAYEVISEYLSIIKTPIWLIGLGIDSL